MSALALHVPGWFVSVSLYFVSNLRSALVDVRLTQQARKPAADSSPATWAEAGCGTVGALPPNPFFGKSLPPAVGVLPPGALFGAPLPPAARHVYGGLDPLAHYLSLDCEADLEIRL